MPRRENGPGSPGGGGPLLLQKECPSGGTRPWRGWHNPMTSVAHSPSQQDHMCATKLKGLAPNGPFLRAVWKLVAAISKPPGNAIIWQACFQAATTCELTRPRLGATLAVCAIKLKGLAPNRAFPSCLVETSCHHNEAARESNHLAGLLSGGHNLRTKSTPSWGLSCRCRSCGRTSGSCGCRWRCWYCCWCCSEG